MIKIFPLTILYTTRDANPEAILDTAPEITLRTEPVTTSAIDVGQALLTVHQEHPRPRGPAIQTGLQVAGLQGKGLQVADLQKAGLRGTE